MNLFLSHLSPFSLSFPLSPTFRLLTITPSLPCRYSLSLSYSTFSLSYNLFFTRPFLPSPKSLSLPSSFSLFHYFSLSRQIFPFPLPFHPLPVFLLPPPPLSNDNITFSTILALSDNTAKNKHAILNIKVNRK